jgi:hypothetical protein
VTATWKTVTASEVQPGDRIRLKSGDEVLVSRIEVAFFGRPEMVAFIEDTPTRWHKQPMPTTVEVEVQTGG